MLVFAIIIGLAIGFGTAFIIVSELVKRSNDIGDSWNGFSDYSRMPIYYRSKEDARRLDLDKFIYTFGNTREWKN